MHLQLLLLLLVEFGLELVCQGARLAAPDVRSLFSHVHS
jgi:hypothetical protein